jgi:uncharacterized repeat protein (TIGR01451 family)
VYTIRLTEDALACEADDAYIEDILPEGVTFVRSDPPPVSFDGRIIRWNVADLTLDEDGLYIVRLEVIVDPLSTVGLDYANLSSGRQTWHINNCSALWCKSPGSAEEQVANDCEDSIVQLPQLGIEKSLRSITLEPGKEAEFELVVANFSEVTAYTVTIHDQLPDGFLYLEDSVRTVDTAAISLDDTQPLVWVLEDLESKQSIRFTYKVMLDPGLEEGLYTTRVKVYAMDRSGFPFETNEFELNITVGRVVALEVTQNVSGQEEAIQTGKPLTVVTEIKNIGSDSLQDSEVLMELPERMTYVSRSSSVNGVEIPEPEIDGRTLRWNVGDFPVGDEKHLRCVLQSHASMSGKHSLTTQIQGITGTGNTYRSKKHQTEITILP